jgi:hypothetical protein
MNLTSKASCATHNHRYTVGSLQVGLQKWPSLSLNGVSILSYPTKSHMGKVHVPNNVLEV